MVELIRVPFYLFHRVLGTFDDDFLILVKVVLRERCDEIYLHLNAPGKRLVYVRLAHNRCCTNSDANALSQCTQ
jgi:hypothetical protein